MPRILLGLPCKTLLNTEEAASQAAKAANRHRELAQPIDPALVVRVVDVTDLQHFANFSKFYKFLAGSFSAVLKRQFARKYAFDSICQALQDVHTMAPLQSQNFSKKSV